MNARGWIEAACMAIVVIVIISYIDELAARVSDLELLSVINADKGTLE